MITKIKKILTAICFAWTYRTLIYLCVCDVDDVAKNVMALFAAKKIGKSGSTEGREALLKLLNLKSVSEFVLVTETVKDNDALDNLKEAIRDDGIFEVAWRLIIGDWNVTDDSSWQSIISRIRSRLPFSAEVSCPVEAGDDVEFGVIEIVGIVSLIMTVMPKINKIIKNRREKRQNGGSK